MGRKQQTVNRGRGATELNRCCLTQQVRLCSTGATDEQLDQDNLSAGWHITCLYSSATLTPAPATAAWVTVVLMCRAKWLVQAVVASAEEELHSLKSRPHCQQMALLVETRLNGFIHYNTGTYTQGLIVSGLKVLYH